VGLLDSIKLSSRSASNVFLQKKLQDACDEIEQGRKMSVALTNQKIFPNLMIQMLAVGEETGNLAEMFKRVADYYDNDLESSLESLTSLMEPAMMVFVGFIVFFFVIGVLLPIMGISQAIQSQM